MAGLDFIFVDSDRYGGAYSGGAFTAWIGNPPEAIDAGDGTCAEFWATIPDDLHRGVGVSVEAAILDLLARSERWLGSFDLIATNMTECRHTDVWRPELKERFPLLVPALLA
jgi:hypothetical protein